MERLYEGIRRSAPDLRRFLLVVKRDAFNGRPLARQGLDPRWRELSLLAGSPLERVVALEDRVERQREGYAASYRHERARNHRTLLSVLEDTGFHRGLSLASPVLAEAAQRARQAGADRPSGRRAARLDLGLLRYASRAALKLSPFSTLTRVALGEIGEEATEKPLSWGEGPWGERSLLRLRRYLPEQDVTLFCRYQPFREGLGVTLSSTLEEVEPGRYRFFRPERWAADAEGKKLRSMPAALVEMKLEGAVVVRTLNELAGGPRTYRELRAALAEEAGDAGLAAAALDALIEAGVLLLELPWPGNEPHIEKRLLAHLRTLPADPSLTPAIAALDRVVALEEGFPRAEKPARSVAEIDRALDDLWRAETALVKVEPGIERYRAKEGDIWEDVLLTPPAGGRGIFRVSRAAVREILRSAGPWARLAAFQGYRLDFLHTLAALQRRQWPERREVSFLDLFAAAQPLWRAYRKFTSSPEADGWRSAFNPLDLEEVSSLARLRTEIWAGLAEAVRAACGGELAIQDLERLAARIPRRYASPVGACLFVQPAGDLWVLNRIFEGTGRYGSRFTPVMDDEDRRRYTGSFSRAAIREVNGEPAELLDLLWSRGDTLNVHARQTARVLAIPGETLMGEEAARAVSLRDLRVSIGSPPELPRLTDAYGRRLLPVHLGGAACGLMPFLVQFLAQWGPGEVHPLRPAVPVRRAGEVGILERLTAGNLVLARRRWAASLGEGLRRQAATAAEEDAFAVLNRWRVDSGLPERLFWIEKVYSSGRRSVYKPQYLDFSSPLFVEIFRSALRANSDPLTFEEMLPATNDLTCGPRGEPWMVELQLDTLPLGTDDLPVDGDSDLLTISTSLDSVGGFIEP